jgi:formimidoylglutamate deiminase
MATAAHPNVAEHLWLSAAAGGARASAREIGALAAGRQADFVVLDADAGMDALTPAQQLASHVFARHGGTAVRDVWVGGRPCIRARTHALDRSSRDAFAAARRQLLAGA